MDFINSIKDVLSANGEGSHFIAMDQVVIRLGPICLILETVISYLFITRLNNNSENSARKAPPIFWKTTAAKAGLVLYTLLIADDISHFPFIGLMPLVFFYYLYSFAVILRFIEYLTKRIYSKLKTRSKPHQRDDTQSKN